MKSRPIIIAHRGASGYLPEHTLVSKALAVGMGADYLEQDVVATRDGELIVFHDLTLDCTTDVQARFPERARSDGHYYCLDFSLEELRSLSVSERRVPGQATLRYPRRFPEEAGRFPIATLEEEIRFIQGLARSSSRQIGIYPEIKDPAWHREQGIDVSERLLGILTRYGYTEPGLPVFVQCFDPAELLRLRRELGCRLRLVQLVDRHAAPITRTMLDQVAGYADAIGPSIHLVYTGGSSDKSAPRVTSLVDEAHAAGLLVHPYTFRNDDLPDGCRDFTELLDLFLVQLGADGLFTDFPDLVRSYVDRQFPN